MLVVAAAEGMEQLVPLLLAHSARHDATDSNGLSPLEEARRCRRVGIVPLLMVAVPQGSNDEAGTAGVAAEAASASPDHGAT